MTTKYNPSEEVIHTIGTSKYYEHNEDKGQFQSLQQLLYR